MPDLLIVSLDHLLKTKKEFENFKNRKFEIYIHTEMNKTKLAFNMIRLMEVLKIYQEEQPQIKYYVIKRLILLKSQNIMDIKEVLLL